MFDCTFHPDRSVTVTSNGREVATFASHHEPAFSFFVQGVEAQRVEIRLPAPLDPCGNVIKPNDPDYPKAWDTGAALD